MKKLLTVLLVLISLTSGTLAGAQNVNVSIHNWDLLVFVVEGEFHVIPHLSLALGVGSETLHFSIVEICAGVAYFAGSDNSGFYGAGRFALGFTTGSPLGASPITGLVTTAGYRWRLDPNTQLDIELGMFWPIPGSMYENTLPLISLGYGYRF